MFFVPFATDAPVYHWPYGTIGIIVLNALVFFLTGHCDPDICEPYALAFGDGLHPVQWLTWSFLHKDIFHLAINMFVLWSFGLVVEGKIGVFAFVPLYFGIGAVDGAIVQALMMNADHDVAVGSSGTILGILAICMIWAPKNEFSCLFVALLFIRIYVNIFEMAIVHFTLLVLFLEGIDFVRSGLELSMGLAELFGLLLGLGVGVVTVKLNLVDCEGWDLFRVMAGTHGSNAEAKPAVKAKPRPKSDTNPEGVAKEVLAQSRAPSGPLTVASPETAIKRVRKFLEQGDPHAALAAHERAARQLEDYVLPDADLVALLKAFSANQDDPAAIPVMEEFIKRQPEKSAKIRLKLAQLLMQDRKFSRALSHLTTIPANALSPELEQLRRQLIRKAGASQDAGAYELGD